MEGHPCWLETELSRAKQQIDSHRRCATKLSGQWPLGIASADKYPAKDPRAGRGAGDLFKLHRAVEGEQVDAVPVGVGDIGLALDRVAK